MSLLVNRLVSDGIITQEQLRDALDKQVGAKKPIQEVLIDMGFLKEGDLIGVAEKVFHMPAANLAVESVDASCAKLIPYERAKRYNVCPIRTDTDTGALIVAMSDPQDIVAIDDIRVLSGMRVKPILATHRAIDECTERIYQSDETIYDLLKNMVVDTRIEIIRSEDAGKPVDADGLQGEAAPVVRLAGLILGDAIKARASDIHIEPYEQYVEVRYRIDGDLKNIMKIPKKLHARIIARIKILSDLDIAETRKPQDGRTRFVINGQKTDMRISMVPTFYGEKVVMRLLNTGEAAIRLDKMGFPQADLAIVKDVLLRPQGIILVTGPTGSGKTSTLYAALNYMKSEKKNIVTIEDPVEYIIDGINQIQVNPAKDVTFATGLRSILRQDPNIILIGEIRDRETADIAFRSSMTGHLVLSTLHTNDAVSSITRLMDIGLEPYLISSSLALVIAQRLVRLICPHCKAEHVPDSPMLERFGPYIRKFDIRKFYRGKGCEACAYTGYLGRVAIIEMLRVTDRIKELIANRASEGAITDEARKAGMSSLAEAGARKVAEGLTTFEELAKVVEIKELKESEGIVKEETSAAPTVLQPAGEPPAEGPNRILVADDEEDILKIVAKRLKGAGYDVIEAHDGKEALELAHRSKPDLVITDVTMPVMNGFETTRALRSRLETATIPIMMLTAKKDKESELAGLDAGADDYLTKPFDTDKLLARVKMLLKRGTKRHG